MDFNAEQFQEMSNTDEGKAIINGLIETHIKDGGYKTAEDIAGLEKNKNDILTEKREIEDIQRKAFEVLGIKDKLELDKLISRKNNPDASDAELGLIDKLAISEATKDRLEGDLKTSDGKLSTANDKILELSAKTSIISSLTQDGVSAESASLLADSLMRLAQFNLQDDFTVYSQDGLTPSEWYTRWKDSEQGKAVLPAAENSGGEFNGSQKKVGGSEKQRLVARRNELAGKSSLTQQDRVEINALNKKIRSIQ